MSNKGGQLVQVDTDDYRQMLKKVYTHDTNVMEVKAQAEYQGSLKVARNLKESLHNMCGEAIDELEELLHAVKWSLPHEAKTYTRDLLIEIGKAKRKYHDDALEHAHHFETELHKYEGDSERTKKIIEVEKQHLKDFEAEENEYLEKIAKRFVDRKKHHLSQIFLTYWKDHDRVRSRARCRAHSRVLTRCPRCRFAQPCTTAWWTSTRRSTRRSAGSRWTRWSSTGAS